MEKSKKIVQDFIFETILGAKDHDEEEDYFSTYETKLDTDIWMQLTTDSFNAFYPFSDSPIKKLEALGLDCSFLKVISWERDLFLTLEFNTNNYNQVSEFIVLYFKNIFNIKINEDTFFYINYDDYPETDDDYLND